MKKQIILLAIVVCQALPPQLNAQTLQGSSTVIDGDTIKLNGNRIRPHGIDAPESGQSCLDKDGSSYQCGLVAAEHLSKLVSGKTISCSVKDIDKYGRYVAKCLIGNTDINELLVYEGYALAYKQYSQDYIFSEAVAIREKAGLWQGLFVKPWDWRKGERLASNKNSNKIECDIKGNISNSGKIYHTPSSPFYEQTKINEAKGERWFCSEAEALKAGWRAPK